MKRIWNIILRANLWMRAGQDSQQQQQRQQQIERLEQSFLLLPVPAAPTHKHTHRDKWYEWYDVIRLSHIPCIQIIYLTGRSQEFKTINYQIVLFVIVFCALRPVLGIQCLVSCLSCPMCRVLCLLSLPGECPAPNAPIGTRKTIIMVAFYIIYCLCAGLCDCVCVN